MVYQFYQFYYFYILYQQIFFSKMLKNKRISIKIDQKHIASKIDSSYTKIPSIRQQKAIFSKIYQMPKAHSYAAIDKLQLSKAALQKIKWTLQIQHTSELEFQERMKLDDYYINYEKNPFSKETIQTSPSGRMGRSPRKLTVKKEKNIVDSINCLKEKTNFTNMINRFGQEQANGSYMHRIIKDKEKRQQRAKKNIKNSQSFSKEQEDINSLEKQTNSFHDLDRIIELKQQNFYQKSNENKSHNIFKVIKSENNNIYLSYHSLKKLYFCEESTATRVNAIKITNIFRDMSFVSRMLACGRHRIVPKDYKLVQADIKAILQQINFSDLMLISSGAIYPDILQAYLYDEVKSGKKDDDGSSMAENEKEISYQKNQNNQNTNYYMEHHDKAQIQSYINHSLSKMENKQKMLSQMYKQKMLAILLQQQHCTSANIHDNPLRCEINSKKKDILIKQFDDQIRKPSGSIDKIIRMNKMHKDKVEKLRNALVIENIQMKKQFQRKIRQNSKKPHHQSLSDWR